MNEKFLETSVSTIMSRLDQCQIKRLRFYLPLEKPFKPCEQNCGQHQSHRENRGDSQRRRHHRRVAGALDFTQILLYRVTDHFLLIRTDFPVNFPQLPVNSHVFHHAVNRLGVVGVVELQKLPSSHENLIVKSGGCVAGESDEENKNQRAEVPFNKLALRILRLQSVRSTLTSLKNPMQKTFKFTKT